MTIKVPKPPGTAVTFQAPTGLVEKLDRLAELEMSTRAAVLRRIAARAVAADVAYPASVL